MITFSIEWARDPAKHQLGGKYSKFGIVGYTNNSYDSDVEDKKSITRYCFFLEGAIIT